ncbi:ferritin-like domain-containing protein [Clostridium sp. SYSU_GA19001]|uniref:ferritin-like domain-containing protein n=1 Tax=Clostridium caldaquaticum TaxID=2940653 RepID=UPI002076E35C|nr:ferritin-like domain-containing protein [Clostridium caldaquaticum]MCM8709789.1 ferritin-like domain-containing protein [Clostridium caldaquaticum]
MNNDEIYLTKMLRGENMGINLYNKYLKKIPEGKYKIEIEKFKNEHIRHRTRLQNIMQSRDIEVSSEVGIQGKMTELMTSVKLMFKNEPKLIMKELYKGEMTGVKYSEKYLSEFSESIRPDIEKIIKEDKERISKLDKILKTL